MSPARRRAAMPGEAALPLLSEGSAPVDSNGSDDGGNRSVGGGHGSAGGGKRSVGGEGLAGGGKRPAGEGNRSADGGNRSVGGGRSAGGGKRSAAEGNRSAGGGNGSSGGGDRGSGRDPVPSERRKSETAPSGYDADSIETLEGLEAVRKRPAMYIGGNGSEGLTHLLWEIVDNAVDEAAAGFADKVDITLRRDGSIEVIDNGRGIPVDKHPDRDVSALEVVFTELHAGGKFGDGAYKTAGGLHGVGASVVNALSTRLDVEVRRGGHLHELSFSDQQPGHFVDGRFKPGSEVRPGKRTKTTGTKVRFCPDADLFDPGAYIDADEVRSRVRQMGYLVPGLRITVADNRPGAVGEPFTFVSRGGLADLVKERSERTAAGAVSGVITVGGVESFVEKVPVSGKITEVQRECTVEIALRWTDGFDGEVVSFVNTIPTSTGGTHLAGFDKALTRVVNNVLLKDNRKLARAARTAGANSRTAATKDDVREGLVAAVKVTVAEPQFRGQTKQELGTPAIEGIVARITYEQLKEWFEPGGGPRSQVKAVGDKLAAAVVNRIASKQLLDNKRKVASLGSTGMPDKLADCRIHGPKAELFLVEGDSAAGPAKRGARLGVHGDPAAAGQDRQRGQGQCQAGARQRRGAGDLHRHGRRSGRSLRHRLGPLRADHRVVRRRRGRQPHPLPAAHADTPLHG